MVDVDPSWINKAADPATDPAYHAAELRRNEAVLLSGAGTADRLGARQGVRPGADAVSLAGTTITVHDVPVVVYPAVTSISGPYRVALLATAFEHDPPHGSLPRKDIVCAQVQDHDEDSSGLRVARPVYVPGVAAASPVEPALPSGAFRLATVDVPASGGGGATLTYNAPRTVANGGVLPVRSASELPVSGLYEGLYVDVADEEALYRWSGAAWQRMAPAQKILQTEQATDVLAFTNTTYFFASPSAPCSQTFIVPPSGSVAVDVYCLNRANTFNVVYISFSINEGTTVSGTELHAPNDSDAFRHSTQDNIPSGNTGFKLVTGLTPGQEVTAWVRHRISGGNGDLFFRRITVWPQP